MGPWCRRLLLALPISAASGTSPRVNVLVSSVEQYSGKPAQSTMAPGPGRLGFPRPQCGQVTSPGSTPLAVDSVVPSAACRLA